MSNVLSRGGLVAAALVCFAVSGLPVRACPPPPETLTLKSGYTSKVQIDGARQVVLSVTLDARGSGSGTLSFDPNILNEFGSTQIAIKDIPIRIELVRDDEPAAKGRRLYELKREVLDDSLGRARVEAVRWFLVRPFKDGAPCYLVFVDKDGKFQDVLTLQ